MSAEAHSQAAETLAVNAETYVRRTKNGDTEAFNRLQSVYTSWSWRITWPLRKLLDFIKWACSIPVSVARFITIKAMAFAIKRERLRSELLAWVNDYPRIKTHLFALGQERGLFQKPTAQFERTDQSMQDRGDDAINIDFLTTRERKIYEDLKKAVEQHRKGRG